MSDIFTQDLGMQLKHQKLQILTERQSIDNSLIFYINNYAKKLGGKTMEYKKENYKAIFDVYNKHCKKPS
ncbi:MAG: hypothetical protein ACI9CD_000231 [Candidatus Deianiraeaceae bacterium]|jgi:uncharacterized protein YwlG (UPF0340 family)